MNEHLRGERPPQSTPTVSLPSFFQVTSNLWPPSRVSRPPPRTVVPPRPPSPPRMATPPRTPRLSSPTVTPPRTLRPPPRTVTPPRTPRPPPRTAIPSGSPPPPPTDTPPRTPPTPVPDSRVTRYGSSRWERVDVYEHEWVQGPVRAPSGAEGLLPPRRTGGVFFRKQQGRRVVADPEEATEVGG